MYNLVFLIEIVKENIPEYTVIYTNGHIILLLLNDYIGYTSCDVKLMVFTLQLTVHINLIYYIW